MDRRREVEAVFQEVVGLPKGERADHLDRLGLDESVRAEIEALLDYDERAPKSVAPRGALVDASTRDCAPVEALDSASLAGGEDRPTSADDLPPGTAVTSRYRVERLLGRGGMGSVYLAADATLERPVALKFLGPELVKDADQRRRFLAEARTASALNHPNVCIIYEVGETADGHPFLAMECVEGCGLDERAHGARLSIRETLTVATQLASALDAAHRRGIVHRDIKPANIRLASDGRVKVLDFGLAKRVATDESGGVASGIGSAHTLPGTVMGTPAYMSPEQALGKDVDARSDLFSVGVVLYELLSGRRPFTGSSFAEVLQNVVSSQPEALARFNYELPAELERITRKCLEKDPACRYQTAKELLIDLRTLRRDLFQSSADTEEVLAAEVTALDPATVDAELLTPRTEEVRGSDVFIGYANIDDRPMATGRDGWISQFHRNLELRVAQLSGEAVRVWRQPDPGGRAEIEEKVLKLVPDVKTFVSIVSPPFVKSPGCRKLVEAFWRNAHDSGRFLIEDRPRLFNVVKSPVDPHEMPRELAPLFAELAAFEFFERDPDSGRLREFDEAFGEMSRQRFYERIYDLAYEICQVLRHLSTAVSSEPRANGSGRTVFLATTTSDLDAPRDQLRRALVELGHDVLPKQQLPFVAQDLVAVVRGCLERCDLAIHLIGDRYGLVPEDTDLSLVAIQNQVAAEVSAAHGLARLIWVPKGVEPRDERQRGFVEELSRSPELHRGAEVIIDSLENLKELVELRCRAQVAAPSEPVRSNDSPRRVYIVCDPADEEAVEALEDTLFEAGLEVSLPAFDVDEAEAQKIHIQNLTDCDGVLIFYGAAGKHWVDFKVRELQKAAGYRGSRPIEVAAVLLAPPFDRRKERFKSLSVDVIRVEGGSLPEHLAPFVAKVRALADETREAR